VGFQGLTGSESTFEGHTRLQDVDSPQKCRPVLSASARSLYEHLSQYRSRQSERGGQCALDFLRQPDAGLHLARLDSDNGNAFWRLAQQPG
jgi:hypothetical protein